MLSRSTLRRTALLLVSLLLFAQGALAATGCDWLQRSPAQAVAGGESPPCHEAAPKQRNANLCLADCQGGMLSLDKPSVIVHAMPVAPVLVVRLIAPSATVALIAALSYAIHPPGAPPPRILFHSFLI